MNRAPLSLALDLASGPFIGIEDLDVILINTSELNFTPTWKYTLVRYKQRKVREIHQSTL